MRRLRRGCHRQEFSHHRSVYTVHSYSLKLLLFSYVYACCVCNQVSETFPENRETTAAHVGCVVQTLAIYTYCRETSLTDSCDLYRYEESRARRSRQHRYIPEYTRASRTRERFPSRWFSVTTRRKQNQGEPFVRSFPSRKKKKITRARQSRTLRGINRWRTEARNIFEWKKYQVLNISLMFVLIYYTCTHAMKFFFLI